MYFLLNVEMTCLTNEKSNSNMLERAIIVGRCGRKSGGKLYSTSFRGSRLQSIGVHETLGPSLLPTPDIPFTHPALSINPSVSTIIFNLFRRNPATT